MSYIFLLIVLFGNCMEWIHSQDLFDYSDVGAYDPISYLWNNRDNLIQDSYAPCVSNANGFQREGTCMLGTECKLSRGRAQGKGSCSLWNSCCVVEKTCNATTSARVSYFVNPSNPRLQPQPCSIRIQLANQRVCQIRVDIISMTLANPQEMLVSGMAGQDGALYSYQCLYDKFYVDPPVQGLPDICGQTTNNHFYIHLNQNNVINRAVSLNFDLEPFITGTVLPAAQWQLKITQLECPTKKQKLPREIQYQPKKENKNQPALDFNRLAPDGCLQYYTDRSGIIKNFGATNNYNVSTPTTSQDYAMCFKRTPGSCGVRFSEINGNLLNLRDTTANGCIREYLYFPEEIDPTKAHEVVCQNDPAYQTYISRHPGPLYVHFHSDPAVNQQTTPPYGFYLMYDTNVPCTASNIISGRTIRFKKK